MKDIVISVGFKEGTQKISITIPADEWNKASNESVGMAICSAVAQLFPLEIAEVKAHEE